MCHKQSNFYPAKNVSSTNVLIQKTAHKQNGSMVVMALFIIVVVGLLAAAMIKIISASSDSTIHQIYGLRAQQAAKAGIEELMSVSFPIDGSVVSCNGAVTSAPSFSDVRGLNGCIYDAACDTQTITFNGAQHVNFKFSSTGRCEINTNVVTRTLSVDAVHQITP